MIGKNDCRKLAPEKFHKLFQEIEDGDLVELLVKNDCNVTNSDIKMKVSSVLYQNIGHLGDIKRHNVLFYVKSYSNDFLL